MAQLPRKDISDIQFASEVNKEGQEPGEVSEYKLSEEELEQIRSKFGYRERKNKAVQKSKQPKKVDRYRLSEEFERGYSVGQIAQRFGTSHEVIERICKNVGIELGKDERLKKFEEGDAMAEEPAAENTEKKSKMDVAREKLPKEKLERELQEKTEAEICREYGLDHWMVYSLKQDYGMQHITRRKKKAKKDHPAQKQKEQGQEEELPFEPEQKSSGLGQEVKHENMSCTMIPDVSYDPDDELGEAGTVKHEANREGGTQTDGQKLWREIYRLKDQVEVQQRRIEKLNEELKEFKQHRHQLGPGQYSEKGVV